MPASQRGQHPGIGGQHDRNLQKRFRVNRTFVGGYDFDVKIEKDSTNKFVVKDITSDEWGVTLGWSWSQSSFTINTSGNIITVDVWGKEKYNIFLEGVGTVYNKGQHYRMEIDRTTGVQLSIKKVN